MKTSSKRPPSSKVRQDEKTEPAPAAQPPLSLKETSASKPGTAVGDNHGISQTFRAQINAKEFKPENLDKQIITSSAKSKGEDLAKPSGTPALSKLKPSPERPKLEPDKRDISSTFHTFTWNPHNFAGFYYDINEDIGNESLTISITNGNKLSGDSPYGIIYETSAQKKEFKFKDWGYYNAIGFMGELYFAGYSEEMSRSGQNAYFASKTSDNNQLSSEQLFNILIDANRERIITSATPLKLGQGYELALKSIDSDGERAVLELFKDGQIIDSKVISPSAKDRTIADETFVFKADIGSSLEIVLIAVHLKNVFRGVDLDQVTIDGVWQLSDTPVKIEEGTSFSHMTISSIDPNALKVTMNNRDDPITLGRNKIITLMPGIDLKFVDANPIRFYIYKEMPEEKSFEIRGELASNDIVYTPHNFAGFYYDINEDIGNESLTISITNGNKLSGDSPYGIIYETSAQKKKFKFKDWGCYNVIGFMGELYFAGYSEEMSRSGHTAYLASQSAEKNLLSRDRLLDILIDDNTERSISSGNPLYLKNGYSLNIKSINISGERIYLELFKDGQIIDSKVISPSAKDRTIADETFVFKADIGSSLEIVLIAVHFKNSFRGIDTDRVTIDGVWQLSDAPVEINEGVSFAEMTIKSGSPDPMKITMYNSHSPISLSKNKDIAIMPNLNFRTANNDALRYYIYRKGLPNILQIRGTIVTETSRHLRDDASDLNKLQDTAIKKRKHTIANLNAYSSEVKEITKRYFEPLVCVGTDGEIQTQGLDVLEDALSRLNDAIDHHESYGTVKIKITVDGPVISLKDSDYHVEVGIVPTLLDKKKLITERIRLLKVTKNHEKSSEGTEHKKYCDLSITVRDNGEIHASSDAGGDPKGELNLDPKEIGRMMKLIENDPTDEDLLKKLGNTLYNALFNKGILVNFAVTKGIAGEKGYGVRLRLIFEKPEIAAIPWEFLYDDSTNTFLANDPDTVLSRYINVPLKKQDIKPATLPLKMLLVISGPKNCAPLDSKVEEELIKEALQGHINSGQVEIDVLTKATTREIEQRLTKKPYNIFHFIGHGVFENNKGLIALMNEDGNKKLLDDQGFADLFLGTRGLGLLILNSCEGATVSSGQVFAGMAPRLVQRGIPAVIAMQYSIRDSTAKLFSDIFYSTLASAKPIDYAVQEARKNISLAVGRDRRDFATPVLYMRAKDGVILDLA